MKKSSSQLPTISNKGSTNCQLAILTFQITPAPKGHQVKARSVIIVIKESFLAAITSVGGNVMRAAGDYDPYDYEQRTLYQK